MFLILLSFRPFRCHCFCCPICLQKLTIYTANDKRLGKVRQECYICRPSFKIIDENGYKVFIVKAPCFTSPCGCDIEFSIYQKGKKVGKIVKRWAEYEREVFTDADVFAVFFPKNIDVKSKALLLAATFLIVRLGEIIIIIVLNLFLFCCRILCILKMRPKVKQTEKKLNCRRSN